MNNLKIMRFLLHTYHFGRNILQEAHIRIFLSCNNPILQDVPLVTLCCREAARGCCLGCPSRWLSQDYSDMKIWGIQKFKFGGTETTFLSKHWKWPWGPCFQVGAQLAEPGSARMPPVSQSWSHWYWGCVRLQCAQNAWKSWFMDAYIIFFNRLIIHMRLILD